MQQHNIKDGVTKSITITGTKRGQATDTTEGINAVKMLSSLWTNALTILTILIFTERSILIYFGGKSPIQLDFDLDFPTGGRLL